MLCSALLKLNPALIVATLGEIALSPLTHNVAELYAPVIEDKRTRFVQHIAPGLQLRVNRTS
jgi:hypothetical protein